MTDPDILQRFLAYVQIDTQSSEESTDFPSTAKQLDLARRLQADLLAIGLADATVNPWGYVLATLPANVHTPTPTVALIAHLDTSPDVSGAGVRPQLHENYDGRDLPLAAAGDVVLRVADNPMLADKVGHTVITSDGTTLLGADDKAGIAAILDALTFLVRHPEVPRPRVRVVITPDEETGRGVEHLTVAEIDADVGYTVDGEKLGEIEDETFCADSVEVRFAGVNVHPGQAKNKMVNAVKVAARYVESLPPRSLSPETTEKREGYVHPHHLNGSVEEATVKFLIRDFTEPGLKEKEELLRRLAEQAAAAFPGSRFDFKVTESYRNMKVVLDRHPRVLEKAEQAVARAGLKPARASIRGGTDGARLCFMGLPTPNLFTGGSNFHSRTEWITLQDMKKISEVLVHLVRLWAEG